MVINRELFGFTTEVNAHWSGRFSFNCVAATVRQRRREEIKRRIERVGEQAWSSISCKYGATCRYNHPNRYGAAFVASPASHLNLGIDPGLTQAAFGLGQTIYPQRPGQFECDFYMKSGECKFGERCKYHHPIDRSAHTLLAKEALQENVKLTLAGLPRREGRFRYQPGQVRAFGMLAGGSGITP